MDSEIKKFKKNDIYSDVVNYFNGDTLAADVWINKYCLQDNYGNLYERTPDDMHTRIASELNRIENKYSNPVDYTTIFDSLKNFERIVPQGSPMAGIGNNFQIMSIGNCFVVGNPEKSDDSYSAIFTTDQKIAQLQKRRAGVGVTLDNVRPGGVIVNNAAKTSTGIVPYMERYSNTTREVAQGGRRGALMQALSIIHPQAEDFIDAKMDTTKVTGANISVKITDDFMNAVINNTTFIQKWPIYSETPKMVKEINAKSLWDKIIYNAWKSAEPGVLFWDKIISESPADCYSKYGFNTISTNPCGELPLPSGDSCRLLLLNLFAYVQNPFKSNAYFDYEKFEKDVRLAQRYMDDIVDLEIEKVDKIIDKIKSDPETDKIKAVELDMWLEVREKCFNGRRTGTGITAEGDMLAALGLKYGTEEATKTSEYIHEKLAYFAYDESVTLAVERGAFPLYNPELEKDNPFLNRLKAKYPQLAERMNKFGRRNIALLTIAPAGSVSILTKTTSGVEPAFMIMYRRRRKVNPNDHGVKVDFVDEVGDSWEEYNVFHPHFKTWLEAQGYTKEQYEIMSVDEINELIKQSPYYGATANDVNWVEKVKMQAAIQKWIDHSISVTVNVPEQTTVEMVNDIYVTAWKYGCKGCTIYRDGSRSGVLISEKKEESPKELLKEELFNENHAPKRPKYLDCDVIRFMNKGDKWIGFVGLLNGKPYELFSGPQSTIGIINNVESGKIRKTKLEEGSRYDFLYEQEGQDLVVEGLNDIFDKDTHDISRMISAILRHGMPLPYVIQLIESLNLDGDLVNTWKNGVKRMLKKYLPDSTIVKKQIPTNCPEPEKEECQLEFREGCLTCTKCGNSKCN